MAVTAKKLQPEVLAVLSNQLTVLPTMPKHDGVGIKLTSGQLEWKLYIAVNDVLECLGGKWNRSAKAHLFTSDPTDALEAIIATGEYIDPKKAFAFFATPDHIADLLVRRFGPPHAQDPDFHPDLDNLTNILEPSAGEGALVYALLRAGAYESEITMVELDQSRLGSLASHFPNADVRLGDFLAMQPEDLGLLPAFNAIVGNPPFTRGQDVKHILHAYDNWLAPGGRLAMIGAASIRFRDTHDHKRLRGLATVNGWIEDLPEGSFRESGTDVNTVVVTLDKPR